MFSTKKLLIFSFLFFLSESAFSEVDSSRYFIGTSAFMLANLNPEEKDPPHFYQLNFGYRLTGKDVVSAELITWRYNGPIGVQSKST